MTGLTVNQLIDALEVAVQHEDLQEFSVVIQQLHNYSSKKEQSKILQGIDELADKYPTFNWKESVGETEPQPSWILNQLPTIHSIKLEGGIYPRLEEYLKKSVFPQPLKPKEIEKQMDQLFNDLLKDFLRLQQHAEA